MPIRGLARPKTQAVVPLALPSLAKQPWIAVTAEPLSTATASACQEMPMSQGKEEMFVPHLEEALAYRQDGPFEVRRESTARRRGRHAPGRGGWSGWLASLRSSSCARVRERVECLVRRAERSRRGREENSQSADTLDLTAGFRKPMTTVAQSLSHYLRECGIVPRLGSAVVGRRGDRAASSLGHSRRRRGGACSVDRQFSMREAEGAVD